MSSKQPSIQKVLYPTTRPSSSSSATTTSKSTGTKYPTMDKIFGIRN
ncbi:hypothetical protein MtrunA17_Chr2g0297411 [Medicago truncatula]|uniref:Uncharacterized protein n=1 Tax=Medicago truncatula TaxID=3880 RepID=A0A396J7P3_MEDTR|nr:hypothetical protein MtrunA17_Chr2g0297411 [Medicago truncatula]